jgi:hypothetical protein
VIQLRKFQGLIFSAVNHLWTVLADTELTNPTAFRIHAINGALSRLNGRCSHMLWSGARESNQGSINVNHLIWECTGGIFRGFGFAPEGLTSVTSVWLDPLLG